MSHIHLTLVIDAMPRIGYNWPCPAVPSSTATNPHLDILDMWATVSTAFLFFLSSFCYTLTVVIETWRQLNRGFIYGFPYKGVKPAMLPYATEFGSIGLHQGHVPALEL